MTEQSFEGAVAAGTWGGQLAVFPFWSNTQVLWYRKSFVEKAGIDMAQPVTWDQIIDAASENGGQIGVQANKYEGYVVWINALISGAGGAIARERRARAPKPTSPSTPMRARTAARIIEKLASSTAAPPDLSVSKRARRVPRSDPTSGRSWSTGPTSSPTTTPTHPDVTEDIGYTMYPETVEGEEARPPYGGIGIGVSEYSDEKELALEAAECLVSPENQGVNADLTGNMPASAAGYDYPALQEKYPADLLQLFQDSVEAAAPRTATPYWSDISSSIQSTWHSPGSVDQNTPEKSATFIDEILHGEKLL